jgi:predicted ATP-grasp superfamily ATP-dependent carboligase
MAPDSRHQPEALAEYLVRLGQELGDKSVLYPTRDDDVIFLNRFRKELEAYFSLVIAPEAALEASLNKWKTFLAARRAQVPAPRAWMIENERDLDRVAGEAAFPCVLKTLSAHHWRQGVNWQIVGARKAFPVHSEAELRAEYREIGRADKRALLQEMIPGADDALLIVACYVDRRSRWVAGFNTQKVLQIPEGFGTGCIVQSVDRPELFERTVRLLESIGYSGIAEVEYKRDARSGEYQLIEINPRPWDQHRLGYACGVELMYLAYCDHAGLPLTRPGSPVTGAKWIAEDAFSAAAVRSLGGSRPSLSSLFGLARGQRIYAIWSAADPLPAMVYWLFQFLPDLLRSAGRALWSTLRGRRSENVNLRKKEIVYEPHVGKPESLH